jgi:hypothetical protein
MASIVVVIGVIVNAGRIDSKSSWRFVIRMAFPSGSWLVVAWARHESPATSVVQLMMAKFRKFWYVGVASNFHKIGAIAFD